MDVKTPDKKYSSKLYTFFDILYKLLVINILTLICSLPIITIFPMIVVATATIKNDLYQTGVIKPYFKNLKTYFLKCLPLGIILPIIFAAGVFAILFWMYQDFGSNHTMEIVAQIGIAIVGVCLIIFTFMIVHMPLLRITFEKLTNYQIFKMSLYVSVKYILTTFIMLIIFILSLVLLFFGLAEQIALASWTMLGISLPLFIVVKLTLPIYYRFAKIDFEEIAEQARKDAEIDE